MRNSVVTLVSLPETPLKPQKDLQRPEKDKGESIGRDEKRRGEQLSSQNGPGEPGGQCGLQRNRQRFSHGASPEDIARRLPCPRNEAALRKHKRKKALSESERRAICAHYSASVTHLPDCGAAFAY